MTDDDAKDWVSIRVPEADRETCKEYRPDDATYGDCLVAGAERLNEHLDSDTARFGGDVDDALRVAGVPPDAETVAEAVVAELDGDGPDADELAAKITDDLLAQLPRRIAEELER